MRFTLKSVQEGPMKNVLCITWKGFYVNSVENTKYPFEWYSRVLKRNNHGNGVNGMNWCSFVRMRKGAVRTVKSLVPHPFQWSFFPSRYQRTWSSNQIPADANGSKTTCSESIFNLVNRCGVVRRFDGVERSKPRPRHVFWFDRDFTIRLRLWRSTPRWGCAAAYVP